MVRIPNCMNVSIGSPYSSDRLRVLEPRVVERRQILDETPFDKVPFLRGLFTPWAVYEIMVANEEFLLIGEDDILGVMI